MTRTKRQRSNFKHGEPVWARPKESQWWPGRIVRREELQLQPGEAEPVVGPDMNLVQLFNNDKRFAVVTPRFLRPFGSKRFDSIYRHHSERNTEALEKAVREAREYSAANGCLKVDEAKMAGRKRERAEAGADGSAKKAKLDLEGEDRVGEELTSKAASGDSQGVAASPADVKNNVSELDEEKDKGGESTKTEHVP